MDKGDSGDAELRIQIETTIKSTWARSIPNKPLALQTLNAGSTQIR